MSSASPEVALLRHADMAIARAIRELARTAYEVEADLIGTPDFPPLRRTAAGIRRSSTEFYGIYQDSQLQALVELEATPGFVTIASLAVSPGRHRRGLGQRLLRFVIASFGRRELRVSTAAANAPARALYEKHGFTELPACRAVEGYELVNFRRAPG